MSSLKLADIQTFDALLLSCIYQLSALQADNQCYTFRHQFNLTESCSLLFAATLDSCGRSWNAIAAICLGMAGVDTPQEQVALTSTITGWFPPNVGMTITG